MKKLSQETCIWIGVAILIAALLFTSVKLDAQNIKKGLAVAGYHIGTVALGAVADGLYDNGNKEWSHALHAVEVGALIGGPFVFHVQKSEALSYILSYGFVRFSLFDSFYAMTRDLPIMFNGTTSTYDEVMAKMPDHGKVFVKSWSLVLGITIPITYF